MTYTNILTLILLIISRLNQNLTNYWFIYKDGKAKQVVLAKGLRTENSVQVISGLSVGDTLLTTGVMQLRDGMTVKLGNVEVQAP